MATTDPRLARATLDAMTSSGVQFALLHDSSRLASEDISDLDVVVDGPPGAMVKASAEAWQACGLRVILAWRYDIGGTTTVFLATSDARDGVQLDLMYDPDGVGKYGVRSPVLLASADSDASPPSISETANLVYRWRKRTVKMQPDRLAEIQREAADLDRESEILDASAALTGSHATGLQIVGRSIPSPAPASPHPILEARRLLRRALRPIGTWAHAPSHVTAAAIADRFGRFLVHADVTRVPRSPSRSWWWLRTVVPTVLRPGLVMSWGPTPSWPRPHVEVGDEVDEAAAAIVDVMARRVHW